MLHLIEQEYGVKNYDLLSWELLVHLILSLSIKSCCARARQEEIALC